MLINTFYFQVIFISIILNVHNDPCFEGKSSSVSLKDDAISSGTLFRIKLYVTMPMCYCSIHRKTTGNYETAVLKLMYEFTH